MIISLNVVLCSGLSKSPFRYRFSVWCCHLVFSFKAMSSALAKILFLFSLCYLQIYLRRYPYNTNSSYFGLQLHIWFNVINSVSWLSVSSSKGKNLNKKVTIRKTQKGRMNGFAYAYVLLGKKYLFIGRHGRKGTFLSTFMISTLCTWSHFNLHTITKSQIIFFPLSRWSNWG